jgi:ABC-type transporter Mla subunit MlaD
VLFHDRNQLNAGQMLATALQIARLLAKLAVSAPGVLAERENLRRAIARLATALGLLRPLRGSITGVVKEAAKISQHADELERELRSALSELNQILERQRAEHGEGDTPPAAA